MREVKVLLVSNMYPSDSMPFFGIFIKNIEEGLIKNGINVAKRVTLSAFNKPLIFKVFEYLKFYATIICHGLSGKYDVIYGHYVTHIAIPLLIIQKFGSSKIVINFHGSDIKNRSKLNVLLHFLVKKLSGNVALIIAPSEYFKCEIQKSIGVEEGKIFVFASGGIQESFYNKNFEFFNTTLVLGYVSRLDSQKGWKTFLQALKILKNQNIRFEVIAIGNASPNAVDLIDEYGLSSEIKYLGGMKHSDLPLYYKKMDLFVFPTLLEESLGLVGLEAMANSVPVIASKIGGITDYLEEDVNGFFFEPGNIDSLAEKIIHYIELSIENKLRLRENAYFKAQKFSNIVTTSNLADEFRHIIVNDHLNN